MTASRGWPAERESRGPVRAVVSAARDFLLDPPEPTAAAVRVADPGRRPVIAVFGLARRCGSTVVARAIAAELAARDPGGSAAVACEGRPAGPLLATQPAARLARALEDLPGGARALGRLCLLRGGDPSSLADALRGLAPLVIDVGSASLGGVPACVADRAVIVTTPAIEPALARVAVECVSRVGPEPTLLVNRARGRDGDVEKPAAGDQPFELPHSRLGAQLALGGREPRGGIGRAVSALLGMWDEG